MVESISDWANDKARENPGCVERWNETIWKMGQMDNVQTPQKQRKSYFCWEFPTLSLSSYTIYIQFTTFYTLALPIKIVSASLHWCTEKSPRVQVCLRDLQDWRDNERPALPCHESDQVSPNIRKYKNTLKLGIPLSKWIKTLIFCNSHEPQPCGSSVTTFIRYLYV